MQNLLYYKYVKIKDPESFRDKHLAFCKKIGLLGKVLVAKEGINGCVSGTEEQCKQYIIELRKDPSFADIEFKITATDNHNFKKMFVRIRNEIVTTKVLSIHLKDKAPYIEPREFKQLLESGEEIVVIDARNDYESDIGKFKNAITPDIKIFSEWPEAVKKLKYLKDKPIVTYCTGGIRCEKASAYLKEQGFKNVRQLHGGIIRYGEECGNSHWQGKCFVFDNRGAINIDPSAPSEPITQCNLCRLPCDDYYNCALFTCDKRFIACSTCIKALEGCCSKRCRNEVGKKVITHAEA